MRSIRWIAIAAVVVAALAGCNGDETAAAPPDTSPSVSESGSASPSAAPTASPPPTSPAEASEHTDRGAIAFAKHFVDVLNYTAESGDVSELENMTARRCVSCQNIVDATRRVYAADGYIRGGAWTVNSQSVFKPDDGAVRIVTFEVDTSRQSFLPSAGADVQRFRPDQNVVSVYVEPSGDAWVVTRMDKQS